MRPARVLIAGALLGAGLVAQTRPPNVVLVLADDLGWGEVGCYGQSKIRTPNVDRLAREGMRFTQAYAGAAVCAPSRCVLMTGVHLGHAQVRGNYRVGGSGPDGREGQLPLRAGTVTLGTVLGGVGYATGAFGKWGLGGAGSTGAPENQGFEHFVGYLCQAHAHDYYPEHLWSDGEVLPLDGDQGGGGHAKLTAPLDGEAEYARFLGASYAPDLMIDAALAFVRENQARPFFLYFPSPIPHAGLQVPAEDLDAYPREWDPEPYLGERGYVPHPRPRAAYAAMVTRLDRDLGRILELLEELGAADETVVIFTSDNGPTYNGGTDSEFFASAGPFRGRKDQLYEGGIRVPLVVRWPGRTAPGATSDRVVAFDDLLPTLATIAGADVPAGIDGVDFAPTLRGEEQEARAVFYWEHHAGGGWQAVRAGRWKAVRRGCRRDPDGRIELYDLERDPGEVTDLADAEPEVAERMRRLLTREREPAPTARWNFGR